MRPKPLSYSRYCPRLNTDRMNENTLDRGRLSGGCYQLNRILQLEAVLLECWPTDRTVNRMQMSAEVKPPEVKQLGRPFHASFQALGTNWGRCGRSGQSLSERIPESF